MTDLLDEVQAEPRFDLQEWEARLNEGGSNNGNGDDSDNNGGHRWEGDGEKPSRDLVTGGIVFGFAAGLMGSAIGMGEADRIMEDRYLKSHHFTAVPTAPAAANAFYNHADNPNVELAVGPLIIFVCMALGAAIGHHLEQKFKKS